MDAMRCFALLLALMLWPLHALGQEYSVRAIDVDTGKTLANIPITLRYDCTYSGTGTKIKANCKFIQRRTGSDGLAHFPEAGSLHQVDDIFSLPVTYGAVCCDISKPDIPGIGTIKFRSRTIGEMMQWIFLGD
jgi:hypothetical protein